jgi:peptide deformylase
MDENFVERTETFDGITARIIQHEYDHIDGKLFVDRLTHFRKILLKGKLADISIGKVDVSYRMIFPPVKRR